MGSEMCIRDRNSGAHGPVHRVPGRRRPARRLSQSVAPLYDTVSRALPLCRMPSAAFAAGPGRGSRVSGSPRVRRTAVEKDIRVTPDLILPYDGVQPDFASRPVWCGRGSTVIGAVRIGAQAWIGDEAVIRADGQRITAGERFWLGHRSTAVSYTHLTLPTKA